MKAIHYKDLVTDKDLQKVMANNPAMFKSKTGREWLLTGLNNTRQGYSNGSGVTSLLQMFGLINQGEGTRGKYLTKKGLAYLLSVAEDRDERDRQNFNDIQNETAGIVKRVPEGDPHGPADLEEFLRCLAIDVDGIEDAKRNVVLQRDDPESTTIQRGYSYTWEDSSRTELYTTVKNYLHWFIKDKAKK